MNSDYMKDRAGLVRVLKYLIYAIGLVLLLYGVTAVFPYLLPFFIGLLIAETAIFLDKIFFARFANRKQSGRMLNKRQIRRQSFLYFLLIILCVFLCIWAIVAMFGTIGRMATSLPQMLRDSRIDEKLISVLNQVTGDSEASNLEFQKIIQGLWRKVMDYAPTVGTKIIGLGTDFMAALPMLTFVILIVIMSGYYYINESPRFYRRSIRIFKNKLFVRRSFQVINSVTTMLFRVCGGYIILLLLTFVEAWIGLYLTGLPHAALWAMLCAVLDMLPVLGISVTLIPIMGYFAVNQLYWQAAGIVLLLIIMTIIRRLVEPVILGNAMRLHPLMTILSMTLGVFIYGLAGVLIGPILFMFAREILRVFQLEERISIALSDFLKRFNSKGKKEMLILPEENEPDSNVHF